MANDIVYFLKTHRRQILAIGKKILRFFQNKQGGGGGGGGGGGYGGYAGAAAGGAAAGGAAGYYGSQQQQQQHYQNGPAPQQGYYGGQGGSWDHPPPQGSYGHPPVPSTIPPGVKPHHGRYNDNEINSKNEQYLQWRNQARSEGDQMSRCFDQAHNAHARGDAGRAKQLSNEGHQHQLNMERLNGQAADWIFQANNEDSKPGLEYDLHGLYVKEAIAKTEWAIQQARNQGRSEIHIIVGKGIHSKDHVAHIKPAIEKLMQDYGIAAELDPRNSGVLIVHLPGGGGQAPQGAYRDAGFANKLAQQTSGKDDECTIM